MNITTSTSSAEVSSTTAQTKTNSSPKTSEKSFDEEMVSQQTETQETTAQETTAQEKTPTSEKETINNQTAEKENSQNLDKTLSGNATYLDTNILLTTPQNILQNNLQDDTQLQTGTQNQAVMQNLTANNKINPNSPELDAKLLATENLLTQNQTILTQNIQDIVQTKDLMNTIASATKVDYDTINMSNDDAEFFINLVQNTDMSMQSIATQTTELLMQNSEGVQKNMKVSSVLMEKLAESVKTNQPFRIDFDKDVSVIIKVNKDGSLSANFIPGDKAVEQYLKNNIGFLKQRFDDENLSYSELSYSNHKNQQEQRRKKENDNE